MRIFPFSFHFLFQLGDRNFSLVFLVLLVASLKLKQSRFIRQRLRCRYSASLTNLDGAHPRLQLQRNPSCNWFNPVKPMKLFLLFGGCQCLFVSFRAATIITREDGCQFLRVDKDDFNRILRDVEANTVRLKEHGRDVLVLEKVSANSSTRHSHYK